MTELTESTEYLSVDRIAKTLIKMYGSGFSSDFETNKKLLEKVTPIISKKMRNRVAGQIVQFKKRE